MKSYALLVRSMKRKYKGVSFFRTSSCSRRTTNIISTVEHWGMNHTVLPAKCCSIRNMI